MAYVPKVTGTEPSNNIQTGELYYSTINGELNLKIYNGSAWVNVIGTEYIQDVTAAQLVTNGTHTNITATYDDTNDGIDLEILDKDLRIDTYRSSGAGGQHVNTTDSAVRITHAPSKIVVQCQNERSQHKNKETCMNMLKARLYDYEIKKKEKENQNLESSKAEIGWGHQIRSYVLQPYRLVKDNRTNFESTSPDKILDGEIDDFLERSLYQIK